MPPKSPQRLLCEEVTGSIPIDHPCARWFSSIERSVLELSRQVENVAIDVKDLTEKVIGQETLLKLIKEEYFPQIKDIPDDIEKAIYKHKRDCIASTKAIKRAEGSNGENGYIDSRNPKNASKAITIPKIVIYIGSAIGAALVAGCYLILHFLDKI